MVTALRSALAVALSSCMVLSGAGAPIGIAKAGGDFHLAGASVRGNGTVFAGDTVESDNLKASVVVNGNELTLAPHSRGRIFAEKAVLESGTSELRVSAGYGLEAGIFRLSAPGGKALVGFTPESGKMRVTASQGQVAVHNNQGLLIAQIRQGQTIDFEPQGGASSAVEYTGTVTKTSDGKYLLTDDTTGVTVELRGNATELEESVGKKRRVRGAVIVGSTAAAGATAVVSVTSIAAAAAAAGGVSAAVVTGVVIAGATGGTLGGLAATGTGPFGGDTSN